MFTLRLQENHSHNSLLLRQNPLSKSAETYRTWKRVILILGLSGLFRITGKNQAMACGVLRVDSDARHDRDPPQSLQFGCYKPIVFSASR